MKAYHADKPAESSKYLIQQIDENTGHGSDSNICTKYESNTNKTSDEEFPISHKNFLTKEHYQGASMVKKKQDLFKMAKLCGIPALGRVEDLKISLIQFIEGMSTFNSNYSNFKIEIIDELTKHLIRAAIEEELSQLGVTPKGTVKEIRTLLAQTIEAKHIPNEGHTPRVSQSEPGSTIRANMDAAVEFLVDKANTDTRYIIRNAEIRPPTDKEVEKKIQILESSILKLQEECSAQKKIIQQLIEDKLVHKETPPPVKELGSVEPDNTSLPHKPDHSTAEDINMKDTLAEVLHKLNHHNNVLKVHSDRMD